MPVTIPPVQVGAYMKVNILETDFSRRAVSYHLKDWSIRSIGSHSNTTNTKTKTKQTNKKNPKNKNQIETRIKIRMIQKADKMGETKKIKKSCERKKKEGQLNLCFSLPIIVFCL